ncbi:putative glutathione S-transferase [Streptomonospora nanhaiensis]|uniref:Putative glutathione S-transferase n=2 Tax=Streptomonospora nanhaiensis TaxID=1323731 RepID=A0A853BG14_9ACTN|nr:glutathione S-transferase C-terminal domain-containing protein [Streptomonospora nanhaiensis]NYI93960.1 putative glutathione S-transferase [Streptomonospora nanhaiensis]
MDTAIVATPVDFAVYGEYGGSMTAPKGRTFERPTYPFQERVGGERFPAEPGRYRVYASYACPWAQRSLIVRRLKGLEKAVSVAIVDPVRDGRGWAFREGPGHGPDEVGGFALLRELYEATEPGYDGHISVPVLWDTATRRIVSNHFPDITLDLNARFNAWAEHDVELYPEHARAEIDRLNERVYAAINNGVYKCGFAPSQEAYDSAVAELFAALDELEELLADRRFLTGDFVTEADIRLWVTLARFDTVYFTHFKTNLRRLADYPNLWGYTRDLYTLPAFRETTDFDHIRRHYYVTHGNLNPRRIVPVGPRPDFDAPHDRARLSGGGPGAPVLSPRSGT